VKKRELLKRFYQTVGKYDRPYPYCHLSADATLGVFKIFKKEHYVPLGDYKLKVPLSKIPFVVTDSRWNLLPLDKIVEKVDEKLKTFRLLVKL